MKFLAWLLPCQQTRINLPLHQERLQNVFRQLAQTGLTVESRLLWESRRRYRFDFQDSFFTVKGPENSGLWSLATRGDILSTENGTIVNLTSRLSGEQTILVLFVFSIFFGVSSLLLNPRDEIAKLFPFIFLQILLIYGLMLGMFQREAKKVTVLLASKLR